MTHDYDYDYFVIGAGSGGVRSARIAASHGAKVGIAEGRHYGGTCVNLGCVPKKLFAYASDYGPAMEDARGFGWQVENISFDWPTLIENKNNEIKRLNAVYCGLLHGANVKTYDSMATLKNAHTIVLDNQEITADKILIATGGTPRKPSYPGAEHTIVSDDAFCLKEFPASVVIEGGGYIAVEFAHIFHGLGAKVTLIYRGKEVLKNFDADIRQFLSSEIEKQGINLILGSNITKIEQINGKNHVFLDNNENIECDTVLSAIGRTPNINNLGLENANIDTAKGGKILVNDQYQTSQPNIYAVGDVIDRINLTPVALRQGHWLADTLFSDKNCPPVSYENIATAVFSNPPIGTVGLTEEQAREQGYDITIYKSDFRPLRHTLSGRDERSLMKLVIDKKTDKVLGAHMCGAEAPEILQGIAIAMNMGATKADFDRTIGIHPTAAEEFVTMR